MVRRPAQRLLWLAAALCVSCHAGPGDDDLPAEVAAITRDLASLRSACGKEVDTCAEVSYDTDTELVSICRKPNAEFDRQIAAILEQWEYPRVYQFQDVDLSRSELTSLQESIVTILPELEAMGLPKTSDGITVEGCRSRIVVHSPEPFSPPVIHFLRQRYHDSVVLGPPIPAL